MHLLEIINWLLIFVGMSFGVVFMGALVVHIFFAAKDDLENQRRRREAEHEEFMKELEARHRTK